MWYIYSLIDPRDHRVRYVGKTNNVKVRLCSHVSKALHSRERNHRLNWIRSLVDAGQLPTLAIIESGEGDWKAAEQHWIAFYRMSGAKLVNATDGGEGTEGYRHSVDARAKISIAGKGHHRTHSAEARAKMSVAHIGLIRSAEARAKTSAAVKAAFASPEALARRNAAIKAAFASPEVRARTGAAIKAALASPEARARISAAMKAVWAARKARS